MSFLTIHYLNLFEFSYFIFHTLSYFCCRMSTLPVTPKKEDKENYFLKQTNCWQKKFLQYLFVQFSTPDMLFCGRNLCNFYQQLWFFLAHHQVFCKINILQLCWTNFEIEIYNLCRRFFQKNEDICYFRFKKSYSFQGKHTKNAQVLQKFILQCFRVMNSKNKFSKTFFHNFFS